VMNQGESSAWQRNHASSVSTDTGHLREETAVPRPTVVALSSGITYSYTSPPTALARRPGYGLYTAGFKWAIMGREGSLAVNS
jgi:hypothetical protein